MFFFAAVLDLLLPLRGGEEDESGFGPDEGAVWPGEEWDLVDLAGRVVARFDLERVGL